MTIAIRTVFPGTTTATTQGGTTTHTGPSTTTSAGDFLLWHVVYNSSADTGVTIGTRTFNGVAADGACTFIHSNNQTAGFETFFYWLNPAATTASPSCTASATSAGWESKVYCISGTDNATAPTFETFAPAGTGTTTAGTYTTTNTVPSGGLAIAGWCGGSPFSTGNQTIQCNAQNGAQTDAAPNIFGNSAAGAGSTINFTATLSGADWYAVAVAIFGSSVTNATVTFPQSVLVHP